MLSQGRGRGPNWGAQKEGEEGKLFRGSPPRAIHPHIPDREGCGKCGYVRENTENVCFAAEALLSDTRYCNNPTW